jgi:hypothetical protein
VPAESSRPHRRNRRGRTVPGRVRVGGVVGPRAAPVESSGRASWSSG